MEITADFVEQLRATLDKTGAARLAADAIAWSDVEGKIRWCNESFATLIGRPQLELLGQDLIRILPLRPKLGALPGGEHPLERVLKGAPDCSGDYMFDQEGRALLLGVSAAEVKDAHGARGVVLVLRDVTAWEMAAEAIRRTEECYRGMIQDAVRIAKAETESYSQELEMFSESVAHDLRGPLRSMNAFSAELLEHYGGLLDADGKEALGRVRDASARMGLLIDGLLELARVTRVPMRRERVDLAPMAREAIAAARAAGPNRQVAYIEGPDLWAEGDPPLLRIVVENLLGNAWKFSRTRPNATIEFAVRTEAGGRRVYCVRDDGVGFDSQFASKLFKPFSRLHGRREFEGVGIGLATVSRIIARHGGKAWADGREEAGATFYFTLWEAIHGQDDLGRGG